MNNELTALTPTYSNSPCITLQCKFKINDLYLEALAELIRGLDRLLYIYIYILGSNILLKIMRQYSSVRLPKILKKLIILPKNLDSIHGATFKIKLFTN